MSRGAFQATIQDSLGNVVPECNIEVRSEATGELVQVYDAIEDGDMLGNPLTADANGFVRFYAEDGLYRVVASSGEFEREWRHVFISGGPTSGNFTATLTGMTATTTGDIEWRRSGNKVTMFAPSAITGTSNSTVLRMQGIPPEIRPASSYTVRCFGIISEGSTRMGVASVGVEGGSEIAFLLEAVSGIHIVTTAPLNSGTKGLAENWSITYDLS